jgi:putative tryptophan/tyrosine transport system substrate-binding protein
VGPARFLDAGGLLTYGAPFNQFAALTARYIDQVLRGANPAKLPIEQPAKFELGVNLKSAKALGLTIPQSLLLRADEVIK